MSAMPPSECWHGPIVVGVDGSDGTARAVRWAAAEAARRKLPLRLVHAHMRPTSGYLPMLETRSMHEVLVDLGQDWLRNAAAAAAKMSPTIDVHTELRTANPVSLLIEESRHARLIVVGSHGLGGVPRMLLGSTAEGVAGHAHCPLVVVPSGPDPAADAPVVVGVDGSPVSDAAVAVAFDEAATRNVGLVAVHAWSDQPITEPFMLRLADDDWARIEDAERRLTAEQLTGWREKYPDVKVRRVLVRDRPAASLLKNGGNAQLLVVGSRGRGGFTGALLGSTSRAVLHHAPCPVIVVGPDRDR